MAINPGFPIGGGGGDFETSGDVVVKNNGKVRIRLDHETGSVFVHNDNGELMFHLEMPGSNIRLGGNGRDGDLVLFNRNANNIRDTRQATIHLDSDQGLINIGGNRTAGKLVCRDEANEQTIFLNGVQGDIVAGANGKDGDISVQNANNRRTIFLNGSQGNIFAGGNGLDGSIVISAGSNRSVIRLDANATSGAETDVARLLLGGRGKNGRLQLFQDESNQLDFNFSTIQLEAKDGSISLGSSLSNVEGKLVVHDSEGNIGILLQGDGSTSIGDPRSAGLVFVSAGSTAGGATDAVAIHGSEARLILGSGAGSGIAGNLEVRNESGNTTIHLDGNAGDMILQNADCAEDFEIAAGVDTSPGNVMTLNAEGKLCLCTEPYDKRVAGIVAGGGNLRPGIVLGRKWGATNTVPIALFGRTYCKVDEANGAIKAGDLLTTSSIAGVAMKATDAEAAFGAIVGKALSPLSSGSDMIPVLVALQ